MTSDAVLKIIEQAVAEGGQKLDGRVLNLWKRVIINKCKS
jgi:hypothetical protein